MNFVNPYFLFGLFAILIPVFIHLFNFRRYKTAYFSNVKLLQNILLKTKRESQLQHLIVLLFRILGIAALVFAFAQPYIPINKEQPEGGKLVTLFVDNSYSMEANSTEGSLLQEAIDASKNIVNAFNFSDEFILITNDFSAKESRILTKEEILNLLDEITISTHQKNLQEIVAFQDNITTYSNKNHRLNYYVSDFQRNQFDFSQWEVPENSDAFILQMPAKQINNIGIDSCWFSSPVFMLGQQVVLSIRVHNYGENDIEKLPVKLFINGQQRAMAAINLKAGTYADYPISYNITSTGVQQGTLQIDDAPITFDDDFYFVYHVMESSPVVVINPKNQQNRYLRALYQKDSVFTYLEMPEDQIDYAAFENTNLIVLNELSGISSGLGTELKNFVEKGGNLLILPSENLIQPEWQSFLTGLGSGYFNGLKEQSLKVERINNESVYFKGSLLESREAVDKPVVTKYFEIAKGSSASTEEIMTLENGEPLLTSYKIGSGKVFLSAVGMNDHFGQAHKHALFFIPLHNIGIMQQIQNKIYNIIGEDELLTVSKKSLHSEDLFIINSLQDDFEFIPEQRSAGNETILYLHAQIQTPGFYQISKSGEVAGVVAFNADRRESDLNYYSEKELRELSKAEGGAFELIEGNPKNLTDQIAQVMKGKALWRYFILISLGCFLVEILLLRFWGKAKMKNAKG